MKNNLKLSTEAYRLWPTSHLTDIIRDSGREMVIYVNDVFKVCLGVDFET